MKILLKCFFSAFIIILLSSCENVKKMMFPGESILRIQLENYVPKKFRKMGIELDLPYKDVLDKTMKVDLNTNIHIEILFHPLFPPNGRSMDPVIYWMKLEIHKIYSTDFHRKYPPWLFNKSTLQVLENEFEYRHKERDLEYVKWIKKDHPQADLLIYHIYDREHKVKQKYLLVRWFAVPEEDCYIFCMGTVYKYFINGQNYLNEDLDAMRFMINSVKYCGKEKE